MTSRSARTEFSRSFVYTGAQVEEVVEKIDDLVVVIFEQRIPKATRRRNSLRRFEREIFGKLCG